MLFRNTIDNYGFISKVLHWTIAVLVILMLVVGYIMQVISTPALRSMVINWHKIIGIIILGLMGIRLIWTLNNLKPRLPFGTPQIEYIAEWVVHFAFYFLIILQPIFGWIGSVSAGYVPHIGSFFLNLPLQKNEVLFHLSFKIHNTLAILIIFFVSLHVLAALYHHFVRKDNILRRMWF